MIGVWSFGAVAFVTVSCVAIWGWLRSRKYQRLATVDPLTGLPNFREFEQRLRQELSRAKRHERDLALLWIDLDHFKQVNDRFGHAGGNEVLAEVGRRLSQLARQEDLPVRLGGEEFILLLPDTSLCGAESVAVKVLTEIRQTIHLSNHQVLQVTASVGVASLVEVGEVDLLTAADAAMYRAKALGRNRYCFASGETVRELLQSLTDSGG